jgi:hypothetical protein
MATKLSLVTVFAGGLMFVIVIFCATTTTKTLKHSL